ncbi:hypothetical protein NESM_000279200 [Novymonas esmeraldas]|uniref:Uncharacterized protein n=1 Tax=Novymonas esmeraldas TaxID=1808958 RepID=A0AAW0F7I2_9TRYP
MASSCSVGRVGAAAHPLRPSTPLRRQLGASMDDAAIFVDDTVDRATAQCIDASPSAMALLSPQRLPSTSSAAAYVDVTEYDASFLGPLSGAHRRSGGACGSGGKGRLSHHNPRALHDLTNTPVAVKTGSGGASSKSPTPKAARGSVSRASAHPTGASHNTSLSRSTPRRSTHGRSPSAAEPTVPLGDFEALQRERHRYEKMYEHQRVLYEEMADKHADAYQALQDKILEVVALSTRNEESKRFIRQLKREMSESRTRVMDMQNKALEEAKSERVAKVRYEALLEEQERRHERVADRHETRLAGMESLVADLTSLRGERDRIQVGQLDSLLKAAYAKSTALFRDLLRQGKQVDLLYDAKVALEAKVDQLRKDKREMEAMLRDERRQMAAETERMVEQIEEQQQSILNLRQMLIRTMDDRDSVFAYSRGPRHHRHEQEEGGSSSSSSSSSSFVSSPPTSPIAAASNADVAEEVDATATTDAGSAAAQAREQPSRRAADVSAGVVGQGRSSTTTATAAAAVRPIITASAPAALSSNSVLVPRRSTVSGLPSTSAAAAQPTTEVPPLPLSSRIGACASRHDPRRASVTAAESRGSDGGGRSADGAAAAADDGGPPARVRCTAPAAAAAAAAGGDDDDVVSAAAVSRRRLDFTAAMAAVTEKRRRDRAAREVGESAAQDLAAAKENSRPAAPQRVIVRSGAVGSISTARRTALTERAGAGKDPGQQEEDEEAEPRLFPRHALRPRE